MAYVTADKVANHFGLPKNAVYKMAREGVIPCYRLGRSLRFVIEEVEEATRSKGRRDEVEHI